MCPLLELYQGEYDHQPRRFASIEGCQILLQPTMHGRRWMALGIGVETDDMQRAQISAPKQGIGRPRGLCRKLHGIALLVVNMAFSHTIFMVAFSGRE